MLQVGTYIRTICQMSTDPGLRRGDGEPSRRDQRSVSPLRTQPSDALIDAYSHRTYKENGRYTLTPHREVGLAEIAKSVQLMDMPLTHFGTALLEPQLARKLQTAGISPCGNAEITENPRYRYREPEFEIRPEYCGAYKMYENPRCRAVAAFGCGILPSPV